MRAKTTHRTAVTVLFFTIVLCLLAQVARADAGGGRGVIWSLTQGAARRRRWTADGDGDSDAASIR